MNVRYFNMNIGRKIEWLNTVYYVRTASDVEQNNMTSASVNLPSIDNHFSVMYNNNHSCRAAAYKA